MYQVNPFMRNVLITNEEVIFHAPSKHELDVRIIQTSIIVAEERFIKPALGSALYDDIAGMKNQLVTSSNIADLQTNFPSSITLTEGMIVNAFEFLSAAYLKLWKEYLWKLSAEAVMIAAMPDGYVQFGSSGVIHNAPPAGPMTSGGIVSPDLRTVKWARDTKLQDRIEPLISAMHAFICSGKDQYPKYSIPCPCDQQTETIKKSDIILGLYDDIDNPTSSRCNCNQPFPGV